jgi:hypothetical protein
VVLFPISRSELAVVEVAANAMPPTTIKLERRKTIAQLLELAF